MRYKHFQQLYQARHKFAPSQDDQRHSREAPETEMTHASEEEEFLQAMQDVKPLKGSMGGRAVLPNRADKRQPFQESPEERDRRYLEDLVHGRVEFEIEDTDEYLQGSVKGLDSQILRKLKAGRYSPEAHLDLHGFTVEEAYERLILFVKKAYLGGKRCLLVIPGRGKNSPQGKGVLKEQIQDWLTRHPLKRVTLAFTSAQPQHGGAGALYILVRKYKKSRGKIIWERGLADSDLYDAS